MTLKVSRLLGLVLIFIGTIIAAPANSSSIPDEQWVQPSNAADGFQGFLLRDTRVANGFSWLTSSSGQNSFVCKNLGVGDCAKATSYNFNAVLPPCTTSQELDCIESLSAISKNGKVFKGVFKQFTWTNHFNQYQASPEIGLPIGAAPSMWEIQGAEHSQGNTYLISSSITGFGNQSGFASSDININLFAVNIHVKNTPISFSTDPQLQSWMDTMRQAVNNDGTTRVFGTGLSEYDNLQCASYMQDPLNCVVANPFPTEMKFEIKLKLSNEPTGWLHGRLDQPAVSIRPLVGRAVEMSISANPVKTPIVYYGAQFSTLPNDLQELYRGCGAWPTCNFRSSRQEGQDGVGKKADPLTRNMTSNPPPWGTNTVKELQVWLPLIKNTATASPEIWSIHTLGRDQFGSSNPCFTSGSGVLGVVTTNASAYSEGPPLFVNGSLSYQVSAPHYSSDGSVFKGTYNLTVRNDVARCLYGFSSAPIQASIEVIDNGGSKSVATTSFVESDGWDRLSANNFEFSAPTIKIALSQEQGKPTSPIGAVTPNKPVTTQVKSTILCYKGKLLKKVTSINPKCPSGYKKK